MCNWRRRVAALLALCASASAAQQQPPNLLYPGIGRAATAPEIAAWDTDVRPDFKGLPRGSGSVAQGMVLWEARCASCHGVFGENNEVFTPLVGGTTKDDLRTGRVARLTDSGFPQRTTLMKLSSLSTLWDYIHRAMPWQQPKSLSHDEVYAVTAYLLHLGGIVGDGFALSDVNIREVQNTLPNRHGMTTDHGFWPGRSMGNGGKPDVAATACMKGCAKTPTVVSSLPDFARNAHGNLAQQNRRVGAQRGVDTAAAPAAPAAQAAPMPAQAAPMPALALAGRHGCSACHAMNANAIGPSFKDIAARHGARTDAQSYLAAKIVAGGVGAWGNVPMPAQTLPDADAQAIAQWLASGAGR